MRDEDISQLLAFARAYCSLGWAVQKQLDKLISGESDDINPNAVKLMHDKLYGMNEELDEALLDYMNKDEENDE